MNFPNLLKPGSLAIILAALSIGLVHADEADKAKRKARVDKMQNESEEHFKAADKNGDGGLSKDELAAADKSLFTNIRKYFEQMDANKDGKVTMAERGAWLKAHPQAGAYDATKEKKK
jgi:hypothetical protein